MKLEEVRALVPFAAMAGEATDARDRFSHNAGWENLGKEADQLWSAVEELAEIILIRRSLDSRNRIYDCADINRLARESNVSQLLHLVIPEIVQALGDSEVSGMAHSVLQRIGRPALRALYEALAGSHSRTRVRAAGVLYCIAPEEKDAVLAAAKDLKENGENEIIIEAEYLLRELSKDD